MYPILFSLGHIQVYTLGIFLALALAVFYFVIKYLTSKKKRSFYFFQKRLTYFIVAAIVGGRLFYVFLNPGFFQENIWNAFIPESFSWYGVLITTTALLFYFCYRNKEEFSVWFNFFLLAALPAITVGLIGYFLDGGISGKPTNLFLGIVFDNIYSNVPYVSPVHPVQLYLLALTIFITGLAFYFYSKKINVYFNSCFILFLLSTTNFAIEFLRGDVLPITLGLTTNQVIDVTLIILATAWFNHFIQTTTSFFEAEPQN